MLIRLVTGASRNTPTGVGKTTTISAGCILPEKHPHGRGEDTPATGVIVPVAETPPRAWGRRFHSHTYKASKGNTPTGVGKTCFPLAACCSGTKHPHGRGEDLRTRPVLPYPPETPPRAWGRRLLSYTPLPGDRNTPTGVGKTGNDWAQSYEDKETPPRAWGRQMLIRLVTGASRNTPTGVGKTLRIFHPLPQVKKHPHGRGEDFATITQR